MKIVGLVIHKPTEIGGIDHTHVDDLIANCDITGLHFGELDGQIIFQGCYFDDCTFAFPFKEFTGDLKNEIPMPIVKSCIFRNCHIRSRYFIQCTESKEPKK